MTMLARRTLVACVACLAVVIPGSTSAQSVFGHRIPIKLPRGLNGMQPELALVYDPNAGNGVVGVGWRLTGLSRIDRIPVYGYPFAHSDLGILVRQPDGTYRSKRESFVKFEPVGCAGATESCVPTSWIVHDPSGAKLHYGSTIDSLVKQGTITTAWALARAVDVFGNSWEVTYTQDGAEAYPATITYTKRPVSSGKYRQVEFRYEARTDVERGSFSNPLSTMAKRLKGIEVKSDNVLVRSYELAYGEYGASTGRSHLTSVQEFGDGTSTPNSFAAQEFEWQQGGTKFHLGTWAVQQGDWVGGTDWQKRSTFIPADFDGDGRADFAHVFAPDLCSLAIDIQTAAQPAPNRWYTGPPGISFCALDWFTEDQRFLPGDYNGDGKTDLALAFKDGDNLSIDVFVSNGSTFERQRWATGRWGWGFANSELFPLDLNGDGRTDLGYVYKDAWEKVSGYQVLSNGTSFGPTFGWFFSLDTWRCGDDWRGCMTFVSGDFDGNGRGDIAWAYEYFGTVGIAYPRDDGGVGYGGTGVAWQCGTNWQQCSTFLTGDFTGDGRTDVAYAWSNAGKLELSVFPARGTAVRWETGQRDWKCGTNWWNCGAYLPGDFNGDGKTDIAYAYNVSGRRSIDAHISSGASFTPQGWASGQGTWVGGADWLKYGAFIPGDLDGDGKTDLAYVFNDAGKVSINAHEVNGRGPDLITTVRNGMGGTIQVEYAPSPQVPGVIVPSSTAPGIPATGVQQLVTRIRTSDGRESELSTAFDYHDCRVLPGRIPDGRYLGFGWVRARDEQTGQSTTTWYDQTPGLEGSVAAVRERVAATVPGEDGPLVSEKLYEYEYQTLASGAEIVRTTREMVNVYELGEFAYSQTTASSGFDEFGNASVKVQSADSCAPAVRYQPRQDLCPMPEVVTVTAFTNDTAAWLLGRIDEVTTSSNGVQLSHMKNTWNGNVVETKEEYLDTLDLWLATTMTYYETGNVKTVTEPPDADGNTASTTTEYDADFQTYPWRVTNALGHVAEQLYTADGLVMSSKDVNDHETTTSYDALARRRLETRPDGGTTEYSHSPPGEFPVWSSVKTKVDPTRYLVRTEYLDGAGGVYLVKTTGDGGKTLCQRTDKDRAGRPYRSSAPYYCSSSPPTSADPLDASDPIAWITTSYDVAGRPSAVATPDGMVTTYGYGTDRVWMIDPLGRVTTRHFDARKQVTAIVDAAGQTTTYAYDPLGRTIGVRLPNSDTTAITYDSLGRQASVVDPQAGGAPLKFVYDALDRVSDRWAGEDHSVYTYDGYGVANGKGRLTKLQDASGTTELSYTASGQVAFVVKHVDERSYTHAFTYDLAARPRTVTYPDGSVVEYVYSDGGNLESVTLTAPGSSPQVIASWSDYSARGQPGRVEFGNGVSTDYSYDSMSHLTGLVSASSAAELQNLTYDWYGLAAGRSPSAGLNIAAIVDNRANHVVNGVGTDETQSYAYDALYRLTGATSAYGGTKAFAYDAIGNPTTFRGVVGRSLAFDGQQVFSGTGVSDVRYDLGGNMTHKVLDGTTWDYTWTVDGRLAGARKDGALIAEMVYDAEGQRVKKVYRPASGPTVTTTYVGKTYEKRVFADGTPERHTINVFANGQLIASVTRAGSVVTALNATEGWKMEAAAASMYDGRTLGGAAMKLARLANALLSHPKTLPAVGLGLFTLFAAVVLGALGLSFFRREWRTIRPAWQRVAAAAAVVVFAASGCSREHTQLGRSQQELLAGDTTSGPAIGTYFYHRNHINASSVVTDNLGNEVTRILYLPFGEMDQEHSTGGDTITSKFTGQELDEELGLYNYNARYYDPAIGRFISADPFVPSVTDAQAFNRYSYVRNNPVMYVDPTGHFFEFIGRAFEWLDGKVQQFSNWMSEQKAVRFIAKAIDYASQMVKTAFSDPTTLGAFVFSMAVLLIAGNPIFLVAWIKATAASIAVTALAMAAGIKPKVVAIVATLVGLAAGTVGVYQLIKTSATLLLERASEGIRQWAAWCFVAIDIVVNLRTLDKAANADEPRDPGEPRRQGRLGGNRAHRAIAAAERADPGWRERAELEAKYGTKTEEIQVKPDAPPPASLTMSPTAQLIAIVLGGGTLLGGLGWMIAAVKMMIAGSIFLGPLAFVAAGIFVGVAVVALAYGLKGEMPRRGSRRRRRPAPPDRDDGDEVPVLSLA